MGRGALAEQEYQEVPNASRSCWIKLFDGWVRPVHLPWQRTKGYTLQPGGRILVPLDRAQAWFGLFVNARRLELERDPQVREDLERAFRVERDRAILKWGHFPQARMASEGGVDLGPARLPDVDLTVVEPDGTEWDSICLRELYEVGTHGDHDGAEPFEATLAATQAKLKRVAMDADRAERSQDMNEIKEILRAQAEVISQLVGGIALQFAKPQGMGAHPIEGSLDDIPSGPKNPLPEPAVENDSEVPDPSYRGPVATSATRRR